MRSVPGVVDAQPRITTGVVITADEEIGDDFALVTGATDAYYRQHLRGPEHLAAGHLVPTHASEQQADVVAGRRLGEIAVRVEAEAGEWRDGELRALPLLPGRMHLIQSRFAALQDADRRELTFAEMAAGEQSHSPDSRTH